MTTDDVQAFAAMFGVLADVFGEKGISRARVEAYFDALHEYEIEYVEPAMRAAIKTLKFFPKPVELRELASQFRGQAYREQRELQAQKALPPSPEEAAEMLAQMREMIDRLGDGMNPRPKPMRSVVQIEQEAQHLRNLGATGLTPEKKAALERFRQHNGENA